MNIGEQAISDAKLQLYLDDKLLATEELGVTLASMESYKHTFDQRIDCSQPGKHNIEIRNVTEGDEQTAHQSMFFSITKEKKGQFANRIRRMQVTNTLPQSKLEALATQARVTYTAIFLI